MVSLSKRATDTSSAGSINLGRLLFVTAAAIALTFAAASLTSFEARASSSGSAVSIVASSSIVSVCSGEGTRPQVKLSAQGVSPTCGASYKWEVSGGRIINQGQREVVWDFSGVEVDFSGERPSRNYYTVSLTVEGGASCGVSRAVSPPVQVVAWSCPPGVGVNAGSFNGGRVSALPVAPCPNINLCCHEVGSGQHMPLSATLSGGVPGVKPSFKWILHGGEVVSGQGTTSVMVDLSNNDGQPIVASLEVFGYGPRCSASCAPPPPKITLCRPYYVSETRYRRVYIPPPIIKPRPHSRPRLRRTGRVIRRPRRGHWELRQVKTSTLVPCPPSTSQVKPKS